MSTTSQATEPSSREKGLEIRRQGIDFFTSTKFLKTISAVVKGASGATSLDASKSIDFRAIRDDMRDASEWSQEFWRIGEDAAVSLVSEAVFRSLPDGQRFSNSDCLRHPDKDAFALRGLLSALRSPEVSESISRAASGDGIRMLTCDIARYAPGQYLRRHDDLFDGRVFGLVIFLHEDWSPEYGTELITEQPTGVARVVRPLPGSIAVMKLSGGHFHQVCVNASSFWTRYSVAVHFGARRG